VVTRITTPATAATAVNIKYTTCPLLCWGHGR